ncbi:MAG: nodulation protein NfeD [Calditrichia bacterium]
MKISRFNLFFILIILFSLSFGQKLYEIHLDGVINPVAIEYLSDIVDKANQDSGSAILIYLDTPGGLMKSTRMIIKKFLSSETPIIVYVAPPGARAGSAGVFITMAAHIAVMAPGTNIGAAHPVGLGGGMDTSQVMSQKVTNDAVAFARSIAHERKRNEDWAEAAVRESASITAQEALELNVIDLIAENQTELLTQAGKIFAEKYGKEIDFTDFRIIPVYKSWRQTLLDFISDPTIAYILLLIGIYGLMFEFYNPGAILPGVVGAISLILAFFSLQTLPVNIAGILLILVAFVLFILEIKIPSYGMLTVGGVLSFILGSIMLYSSPLPAFKLPWEVIGAATIFTLLFVIIAIGFALKAQKRKITTGAEGIIGEEGIAMENFRNGKGQILIHGEIWQAINEDEKEIKKDDEIVVTGKKGMKLFVRHLNR